MYQFLKNLLPRVKQYSETLDHNEILVDKSWVLVDDNGNKHHYIFKRNGELILSVNGDAKVGRWEYLSGAQSLLIDRLTDKVLLNQAFVNDALLILRKDSFTEHPFVLINHHVIPDLDVERYLNDLIRLEATKLARNQNQQRPSAVNPAKKVWVVIETSVGKVKLDNFEGWEDMVGQRAFCSGVLLVDGNYNVTESDHYLKSFTVKNGRVVKITRSGNHYVRPLVYILVLTLIVLAVFGEWDRYFD